MRSVLVSANALGSGRPLRLLLWPLLAAVAVFILALAVLAPALAQLERSIAASSQPRPPADVSAAVSVESPPSFSVAVGVDDTVSEMPALQSAMVDYLAFSDEYAKRLKEGALVEEFGTEERVLSPAGARAQVEDGTSVLAVILPAQLTPTVLADIRDYSAGRLAEAPTYPITIVAGPQALNEDGFIVTKYEDEVVRQANEFVADQIRTVAGELTCDPAGSSLNCARSTDETARAFERPFTTTVDEVSGPDPVDYFGPDADGAASVPSAGNPPAATAQINPVAEEAASNEPAWASSAWMPSVVIASALAALTLALTASFVVNRAAGLSIVLVGPWRTMRAQRPFPRQALLGIKLLIGAVGSVVLGVAAAIAATGIGTFVFQHAGGHAEVRFVAVLVYSGVLSAMLVSIVLAINDLAGTLFGVLAAVAALIIVAANSGLPRLLTLPVNDLDLGIQLEMLVSLGSPTTLLSNIAPTLLGFAVATVVAAVAGVAGTHFYDRAHSTKVDVR
ncbi:hypothetical protein [Brevibacterium sp. XM4083]|uniref:hypothetical protein n=1 Tax=Brevibacterium sp. XM4083 TaxID=2583238 RepID=UPI00112D2B5A|nr:hypothetical protein [Brevibacterium sp. XM4083]MCM1013660.1 hypothetical protein [Brevibacterium sp. XM4083]